MSYIYIYIHYIIYTYCIYTHCVCEYVLRVTSKECVSPIAATDMFFPGTFGSDGFWIPPAIRVNWLP